MGTNNNLWFQNVVLSFWSGSQPCLRGLWDEPAELFITCNSRFLYAIWSENCLYNVQHKIASPVSNQHLFCMIFYFEMKEKEFMPLFWSIKEGLRGWLIGWEHLLSCKGHRFNSRHPQSGSQPLLSEDPLPSSNLGRHQALSTHEVHVQRLNIQIHKIKITSK